MPLLQTSSRLLQKGYTLIELLLYISILGILLTSITYFFGIIIEARAKNESIKEVETQGTLVMDYLTQTVRNATVLSTPSVATTGSVLSLNVVTGSLSPTIFDVNSPIFGYNNDGTTTDTTNSGRINATKFVASASGNITTLYAMVGPTVAASPNNKAQMAIYSGTPSPTTRLANSASVDLTASAWNAFPISSVAVTSGTTYWLAYNANGPTANDNNFRYHVGTAGQSIFTATVFGTWPASFSGTAQARENAFYAPITVAGATPAFRVKEGANTAVNLTNSRVQISSLTFKNLSRAGTRGIVQISFVASRINPNNKNEYDYQKTFTTSAELQW